MIISSLPASFFSNMEALEQFLLQRRSVFMTSDNAIIKFLLKCNIYQYQYYINYLIKLNSIKQKWQLFDKMAHTSYLQLITN